MSQKISRREFQSHLAARLAGAGRQGAASLLGMQSGSGYWLLDLPDSGEIIPLTTLSALTEVPLTRPWFAGIASIRGNLYSVVDFARFQGQAATPQAAPSHLLLIGSRHGSNAALLVTRMLGLRSIETLVGAPSGPQTPAWVSAAYTDNKGHSWQKLDVRALLADASFMAIGA
ncbi:MAG: chemotaxis protein CheW [Rhodocyclaceae bacterium]